MLAVYVRVVFGLVEVIGWAAAVFTAGFVSGMCCKRLTGRPLSRKKTT